MICAAQNAEVVTSSRRCQEALAFRSHPCFSPFLFYDVRNGRETRVRGSTSLQNAAEATFVTALAVHLFMVMAKHKSSAGATPHVPSVGVIAPYAQQVRVI